MVDTGDPFAAPAQGGTLKSIEGRLILVAVLEKKKKRSRFPTDDGSGMTDAAKCDLTVLDGENAPYTLHGIDVMSGSMVGQLLPYAGTDTPVLGRLGMEKFDKGMGWVLAEANDGEKDIARTYMAEHPKPVKKDPFAAATSE